MAISLYDVSVGGYLQTLGAITDVLTRGKAHYEEIGADPNELVSVRLFPDMLPFSFQIWSVKHHSLGAIEGCKAGTFGPPPSMPALDYEGLRQLLADTGHALAAVTPEEVNELEGRDMTFQIGDFKIPFVVEDFVMSFSIPNFHFHATTAYDILRTRGVKLGKRDYMGLMRTKKPQAQAI